jgi:hypothetical protein
MAKSVSIQVAKDHLEKLTKANGTTALMELIWNSLDADAKNITVKTKDSGIGISQITIEDDGLGIRYDDAELIFGSLGGSVKKNRRFSLGNRKFHGEEGKGRFKSLSLGQRVKFESTFAENGSFKYFDVTIDINNLQDSNISDLKTLKKGDGTSGVKVTIDNVINDNASIINTDKINQQIEEKLAIYYLTYPDFNIYINKAKLKFDRYIQNKFEDAFIVETESPKEELAFSIKIIEWSIPNDKKIYLCGKSGISYNETKLGIKAGSFNISVYLQSEYIEKLHKDGLLDFGENHPVLSQAIEISRELARKYVRDRLHENAKGFIDEAKREGFYPYKEMPVNDIEEVQRKVFDILALNINDYSPKFSEQEKSSKKLTFSLIKEALETDSASLRKILSEAINLPKDKQDELAEILEKTSLADITTTFKEITDRLRTLYELRLILYEPGIKEQILERKHLHQIVKHNTWIFGEDYSLGADDVNLKNVLKTHLKELGRSDFEEIIESDDNSELNDIPDICLYKQFPRGRAGFFENLVIELKRPSKRSGETELSQVKRYAQKIAEDGRFDKTKTEWTVILLVTDMTEGLEFEYDQDGKPKGEIIKKKDLKVYVKKWIDVISDAESRYQYLKEKLNFTISQNEEGLNLLKTKYSKYLPETV